MIHYRDMTFCNSLSCVTPFCPRRLTPCVEAEARKWWHGNPGEPPISVSDFTMTCRDYIEQEVDGYLSTH